MRPQDALASSSFDKRASVAPEVGLDQETTCANPLMMRHHARPRRRVRRDDSNSEEPRPERAYRRRRGDPGTPTGNTGQRAAAPEMKTARAAHVRSPYASVGLRRCASPRRRTGATWPRLRPASASFRLALVRASASASRSSSTRWPRNRERRTSDVNGRQAMRHSTRSFARWGWLTPCTRHYRTSLPARRPRLHNHLAGANAPLPTTNRIGASGASATSTALDLVRRRSRLVLPLAPRGVRA